MSSVRTDGPVFVGSALKVHGVSMDGGDASINGYQWVTYAAATGGSPTSISGATGEGFTLTAAQVGLWVACTVDFDNTGAYTSARSGPVFKSGAAKKKDKGGTPIATKSAAPIVPEPLPMKRIYRRVTADAGTAQPDFRRVIRQPAAR